MSLPEEIRGAFRRRPVDANKYTVGTVSVVGGSGHYIHAPVIAALGARAAGAGLVQLVVPDASRIAAGSLVPEATFTKLTATCVPPKADVTVVGMGLGVSVSTEVIVSRLLSGSRGRFVIDADALAILASWYGRSDGYDPAKGQELIMTPHEGEAARKDMRKITMKGKTIPHDVVGVCDGGRVILKPAPDGTGLIVGGGMRPVLEAAGIRDAVGKSLGSKNRLNVVKATLDALSKLRSAEEIAAIRA